MDAPSPNTCDAVAFPNRLLCGSLPITREVCEALDCCYDPRTSTTPCYFGNPVTAQCSPDGQATIAISTDVTVPSLDLKSVRLLTVSSSCSELNVYQTSGFLAYRFPLVCGGVQQVKSDTTIYENRLEATRSVLTANGASISRDSTFRLTVRCTFASSSSFIPLQVEVFTLPPPLPVSSPGPLLIEMRIAKDQTYSAYYSIAEYPVLKVLRDPVFVEVRMLQRTDPALMLVLNQCWATPSSDAHQSMQWPITVDRCPYAGDNYKTLVLRVRETFPALQRPSHYQRFVVSTFTFVDKAQQNMMGPVFFHCAASVCVPSARDSCSSACSSRKRRMIQDWDMDAEPVSLVTAEGPVLFITEDDVAIAGSRSSQESLMPGWVWMVVLTVGLVVFIAVVCLALVQLVRRRKPRNEQVEMAAVKT
ncbi:zona pellucida sperm-binding protein 4-like [Lissotriton helveticus]